MDFLDVPFRIDGRGRAALTPDDDHVRDLIRQVLFTNPGERVNRPDFGCGLAQLIFAPNSSVLATATQFLVMGALQRWLGTVIEVDGVAIVADEERLEVTVAYVPRGSTERRIDLFTPPGQSAAASA